MARIVARENLRTAYSLALKGHRCHGRGSTTLSALDAWLDALRVELVSGNLHLEAPQCFVVHDPKCRVIRAAPFRERVLHHAVMRVAGPVLERRAIFDSYACRKGKGAHRARARAQQFIRTSGYSLKLDIRKFFDSIPHGMILRQLERMFKDEQFLQLMHQLISHFELAPGRGLPIGSLVSQHLANAYLEPLDRFIREQLRVRGYVRYMDDMVLWHSSCAELQLWLPRLERFISRELGLSIKYAKIGRSVDGLHFLGTRITMEAIFPDARARRRLASKLRHCERAYSLGLMDHLVLQRRASSLLAAVGRTSCSNWRRQSIVIGAVE